jgi:uncharacterized repeat protein (TIGR01451 family)
MACTRNVPGSIRTLTMAARSIAMFLLLTLAVSSAARAAEPVTHGVKIAESGLRQMKALEAIKVTKTPVQSKLDSRLFLALLHLRKDPRLDSLTSFRFLKPDADTRIAVDIMLVSPTGVKAVLNKLESLHALVRAKSSRYRRISARVRLEDLDALTAMPEIRRVRQAMPRMAHKINTSQGDLTHGALSARNFYGVTGVGVKVGVISDGVDSLASLQASGDLPAIVDVIPGQAGAGDEGSAMLEIVHDLAPGAALAFATADPDEATFAANILALQAAGCNIIVDDIIYLDESPFEDGPVAQAVNTVTAAGVLYFSSAGNEGNMDDLTSGTWEGDFLANGTPPALAGAGPVHNFGDGGQSIEVEFGDLSNTPVVLIWAEHFDLAAGTASTDFDLYDMDSTLSNVIDGSFDSQDGVGGDDFPIEYIGGGTLQGERLVVAQFASGATSSVPMFNLIVFRGELDDALATSGATRGHSAAAAAFSVAATPAGSSFDGVSPDGPYPGLFTSANASESFSSDGPRRILLDPTGLEITPGNRTSTGGIVRQKPDLTAADGVSTAAPTFDPFYGTSAAAPHAAAIAALLKSAAPALTPAQIRTNLINSSIDIEAAGVDRDTGAGIVMAQSSLQNAGVSPQAFLAAGTAVKTQNIGDGDAYVESNEVWNLSIPLTNTGGAGATGITALLTSSTPGVTINSGLSAYPDLAIGATASNTTPFTFTVSSAVACGSTIQFTLGVAYTGGGSPQTFDFGIKIGAPGAPVTFSYAGAPVAIPDGADLTGTMPGAVASAGVTVSGVTGNVYDVSLRIDGTSCDTTAGSTTVGLDHTFVNDLQLTLRSPAMTGVLAVKNTDGQGNNFCQTLLADGSAGPSIQSVGTADAPFTGSYTPNAPFSVFAGSAANGTWQLEAQDFFSGDTGNIRAFSVIVTPAVCDAPPLTANVNATKMVSGTFHAGTTVTYTVTLTNSGGLAQADNPGHEFVDVLPSSLTVVSANASSGMAAFDVPSNTVVWNGALAPLNGSVTITITATIHTVPGGTTVSNQGSARYDADGNGTNESSRLTDDPGVAGSADPTSFVVSGAVVSGTKTAAGTFAPGSTVTYTITLTNSGNAIAADNAGNELTDVLPASLTLVGANGTSGTVVANIGTNTVTWNGSLAASGSVTITITATIHAGTAGTTITNQGSISYDADVNGTNESSTTTDDPAVAGTNNPTSFTVHAAIVSATKTVSGTFDDNSTVTYTIVISNSGDSAAADNAGNELTDVLPASLQLLTANASSGTAVATVGTNTVTWNGGVPAGGSVTVTITAKLLPGYSGSTVSNQASISYDSDLNGTNETSTVSNDPSTPAPNDPTVFAALTIVPTLSTWALMLLAIGLALVAWRARLS